MKPLQLNAEEHGQTIKPAIEGLHYMEPASLTILDGWLFTINIQHPQFLSVVQSPFDNCHSPFSPTTFFEMPRILFFCPASQIMPLPLISLPFQRKKINKRPFSIKSPLPTPNYSSLINDRLYQSITTVKPFVWTDPGWFITDWKFGFHSGPWLHDLKPLVLELYHFVF